MPGSHRFGNRSALAMAKAGPDKQLCGAQRPNQPPGTLCTRTAGWGTKHPGIGRCKRHGGATATHNRKAEVELARLECIKLGVPIGIDPGEALVQQVWESAGNVAFYRELVQQLPIHPGDDEFVPPDRGSEAQGYWLRGEPGVYGKTYHVSGIPTGEGKPHVLVQLYNEERKHLAAVASAALKAGVEERRVRIAEDLGDRIAEFGRALMAEFGVDPASEQGRNAFRKHLTLITGGASASPNSS